MRSTSELHYKITHIDTGLELQTTVLSPDGTNKHALKQFNTRLEMLNSLLDQVRAHKAERVCLETLDETGNTKLLPLSGKSIRKILDSETTEDAVNTFYIGEL